MPTLTLPEPMSLSELRERTTLSVAEAAAVLGIGVSTAYRMVATGELPIIRVGAKRRVSAPALMSLIDPDDA